MKMLQHLFDDLMQNQSLHIYWKDLQETYLGCNALRATLLGLTSPDDIIGKKDSDLVDKTQIRLNIKHEQGANRNCSIDCFNQVFTDTNGNENHFLVYQFPLTNLEEQLIGTFYLACDVTLQKLSEQTMKREKEHLEATLDSLLTHLPEHVYWKDLNSRFLGCNDVQAQSAGFKNRHDMVGKSDYDMPWSKDADVLRQSDLQVINNKKAFTFEEASQTAQNEKPSIFLSKKAPLYNKDGIIMGVLGVSVDITERKAMEENLRSAHLNAEKANEAKSEFLENMRHDIRTPLSGIVGFSELLKSESSEPRIKEYADNLIASSHALLHLMDDVLEAVRVSSGEVPLLKRKFNLAKTMTQVVNLYLARAHEKKLNLSLSFDSALPSFVIGDKIRLHRIALELIGNALNFTDLGHVTVHVVLAKKENRYLVIKMTVSDSGMGIPKDKQQEIYLQFKRLTPSYQGIYKGAGLGLYVVKQFIDELEGEIYIDSEVHKGTCFTCLIPFQEPLLDDESGIESEEDLKTEQRYMTPLTHQPLSQKEHLDNKSFSRVLVVEDNYIAQTVAKSLLSAMECQVDVAVNGIDALTLFDNNHYDLIFMDIGLGEGMDGYEVTHKIRCKSDNANHIPIIALTAHAGDESKQRCIEAGMDAVLTKPLTQAHAADILKSFIPARHVASSESTNARRDLPDSDEEMFQLSQFDILNSEEGLKNCSTEAMLKDLLTLMMKDLHTDLECMQNAFKDQDYVLVEKTAHKIKGGAVYVGTVRMKYACQYVERYWKTGKRELFDALYHQAVSTIEETIIYIDGWLKTACK